MTPMTPKDSLIPLGWHRLFLKGIPDKEVAKVNMKNQTKTINLNLNQIFTWLIITKSNLKCKRRIFKKTQNSSMLLVTTILASNTKEER